MRAGALVTATAADDELVIDEKRCGGQRAVRFFGVVELDCPDEFAGIGLGPQDLAIGRDRNDEVLVQRDPAVRGDHEIGLVGARIHDPGDPGLRRVPDIYSVDCAEAVDDVHGTVVDEGCALVAAQWDFAHALHAAQRDRESDAQILNISLSDLVEFGIPMSAIIFIDHQPILRLFIGAQQPWCRYFSRHCQQRCRSEHRRCQKSDAEDRAVFHGFLLMTLSSPFDSSCLIRTLPN